MYSRGWLIWSAVLLLALAQQQARGQSREYPQTVMRAALKVVPADIAPLFQENSAELLEACVEPEEWWPRNPETRNREDWFYVQLDLSAAGPGADLRRDAATTFPRKEEEAKRFCLERGQSKSGRLPWVVIEQYEKSIEAFRTGSEREIIQQAGVLCYFSGRMAQPHFVSRDGMGQDRGNIRSEEGVIGSPGYAHRTPAARLFGELVRRNGARYSRSLDLSTVDYNPVVDVSTAVFRAGEESVAFADAFLTADLECAQKVGAEKPADFAERGDEFYVMLDEKAGPLVVERIRQAALLWANLIGGAWQAAGSPSLSDIRGRGEGGQPAVTGKLKPKDIIGSKNSNVFHYADCRFAKNISPENIVRFRNSLEARQQGRRQCRECKPE